MKVAQNLVIFSLVSTSTLLSLLPAQAYWFSDENCYGVVVTKDTSLNVRKNTTTKSPVVGKLLKGETVNVYSKRTVNGKIWYQVSEDNVYGWASGSFIRKECNKPD